MDDEKRAALVTLYRDHGFNPAMVPILVALHESVVGLQEDLHQLRLALGSDPIVKNETADDDDQPN